jgi:pilus assembly protein CpaB
MRKRAGLLLIASGVALAGLAALLVMGIARQATEASHAQIPQVAVVTARLDIPQDTLVTADSLEVKSFPADFAPAGAFSTVDDVVGKYAKGFIPRGQIVVAGQLDPAKASPNLSDRIPAGMVVTWLPMPDVLASQDAVHPGDRVDILLTAPIKAAADGSDRGTANLSTQTTLQNVQVYRVGDDELDQAASTEHAQATQSAAQSLTGTSSAPTGGAAQKAIGFLVDHQDAVTIKFVKDSGGTIDLVMRSQDDQQVVPTDGVTLDSLADRFRFRVPQSVARTDAPKQST